MELTFYNQEKVAMVTPLKQTNMFYKSIYTMEKLKSGKLDFCFIICIFTKGNTLENHKTPETEDTLKDHFIHSSITPSFILCIPLYAQKLYCSGKKYNMPLCSLNIPIDKLLTTPDPRFFGIFFESF